jgi:uncharacterized MAPEG superfamily protein
MEFHVNKPLLLVAYMAIITWVLIVVASLIKAKAWTPSGIWSAVGNRENRKPTEAFAGRAERTAQNTLENFVLFAAIALVASVQNVSSPNLITGAQIFFWARIVYIPVYYVGIPMLRTAVWAASILGLAMMVATIL